MRARSVFAAALHALCDQALTTHADAAGLPAVFPYLLALMSAYDDDLPEPTGDAAAINRYWCDLVRCRLTIGSLLLVAGRVKEAEPPLTDALFLAMHHKQQCGEQHPLAIMGLVSLLACRDGFDQPPKSLDGMLHQELCCSGKSMRFLVTVYRAIAVQVRVLSCRVPRSAVVAAATIADLRRLVADVRVISLAASGHWPQSRWNEAIRARVHERPRAPVSDGFAEDR
jgi:hypothetical protein